MVYQNIFIVENKKVYGKNCKMMASAEVVINTKSFVT